MDGVDDLRAYFDKLTVAEDRLLAFGRTYSGLLDSTRVEHGASLLAWPREPWTLPDGREATVAHRRTRTAAGKRRALVAYAARLAQTIHELTPDDRATFLQQLCDQAIRLAATADVATPTEDEVDASCSVFTAIDASERTGNPWRDELRAVLAWALDLDLRNALEAAENRQWILSIMVEAVGPKWTPRPDRKPERIGTAATGERPFRWLMVALHKLFALVKPAEVLAWYDDKGTIPDGARHEFEAAAHAFEIINHNPEHTVWAAARASRAAIANAIRAVTRADDDNEVIADHVAAKLLGSTPKANRLRRARIGLTWA